MGFIQKLEEKLHKFKIRREQNKRFKNSKLNKSKNLIAFILPYDMYISGGILSIYNIAKTSRMFSDVHHSDVILATYPSSHSYLKNIFFKNDESVYNFKQVINIAPKLNSLIIHIPDYLASQFYNKLSESAIKRLKKVKNLQINILNQNIEIMPDKKEFQNLFNLTENITQTTAHHRYSNQETFEKYGIPLHLIPACVDLSSYAPTSYEEKENLIAYSPDENPFKDEVLTMLKEKLPEYKTVEIRNMTFDQYMDTITKAKYTITFGEGFDAYLGQPQCVGSIGIAVYNEHFFPDKNALELKNVFSSYEELINKFPELVKFHEQNLNDYNKIVESFKDYCYSLYNDNDYQNRIKNFYLKNYDFS